MRAFATGRMMDVARFGCRVRRDGSARIGIRRPCWRGAFHGGAAQPEKFASATRLVCNRRLRAAGRVRRFLAVNTRGSPTVEGIAPVARRAASAGRSSAAGPGRNVLCPVRTVAPGGAKVGTVSGWGGRTIPVPPWKGPGFADPLRVVPARARNMPGQAD